MHLISRGLTFVDGYKPDGRVKCTVGLHKAQTQEPVIVFPCLSYPNGDRLRQAMPEGYQSLSALPGKGLLVEMGLESSFRFLPARPPALNQPWFGPEPQQWCIPGVAEGQSFSAPLYLTAGAAWMCDNSKRRHFISNCLPWRIQRPWRPWKADSFSCSVLQRRSRHSARRFFYQQQCFAAFLAMGVALKALPVGPSACCPSLFRLCVSLSSLFTISVQKCHSPLSWAFTHTHTQNMLTNANL